MANSDKLDIEQLETELRRLSERTERLARDFEDERARTALQAQSLQIEENVRGSVQRSVSFLRLTVALVGGVLAVIVTILGVLGFEYVIPAAVEKWSKETALAELEDKKKKATALYEGMKEDFDKAVLEYRRAPHNHLIVLQTDFGTDSPYMGQFKGAIHKFHPSARVQTITAEIEAFDIVDAAWNLFRSSRYYPRETVFVAVTNPGNEVDNPLILRTQSGHTFVGYQNGVFDFVKKYYKHARSYFINDVDHFKDTLSKFGRDQDILFKAIDARLLGGIDALAPIAALLAQGDTPWRSDTNQNQSEGKLCCFPWDKVVGENMHYSYSEITGGYFPGPHPSRGFIKARIMEIDPFGNATTNVDRNKLEQILEGTSDFYVRLPDRENMGATAGKKSRKGVDAETVLFPIRDSHFGETGKPVAVIQDDFLQLALSFKDFSVEKHVCAKMKIRICRTRVACGREPMRAAEPC